MTMIFLNKSLFSFIIFKTYLLPELMTQKLKVTMDTNDNETENDESDVDT